MEHFVWMFEALLMRAVQVFIKLVILQETIAGTQTLGGIRSYKILCT